MTIRATIAIAVIACAMIAAEVAASSTKEQAQAHFQNGVSMMEVEDFAGAAIEFEASVDSYPTKSGLFNLGMCYKALHDYPQGLLAFERLLKEFGDDLGEDEKKEAKASFATLSKLIATVVVQVDVEGAQVRLDEKTIGVTPLPAPIVVGAGKHKLSLSKEGYEPSQKSFSVVSGKEKTLSFELEQVEVVPAPVVVPPPLANVPAEPTKPAETDTPVDIVQEPLAVDGHQVDMEPVVDSVIEGERSSRWFRFYGHLGYVGLLPGLGAWAQEVEGTQVDDKLFNTGMWNGLRLAGFFAPSTVFHIGGYFQFNAGSGDYRYWRDPFTGSRKRESESQLLTLGVALKVGGRPVERLWIGLANDLGISAFLFHTNSTPGSVDQDEMVAQLGLHITPKLEFDIMILTGRFKMSLDIALGVMITPIIGGTPFGDMQDNFGNSLDNTLIWSFIQPMFQLGLSFGG